MRPIKSRFGSFIFALFSLFLLQSCQKTQVEKNDFHSLVEEYDSKVTESANMFADGPESALIFTREEFEKICSLEDSVLNIFTDADLLYCMPVESENCLTYDEKLRYLRARLSMRTSEDGTVETYSIRANKPAFFDATPDIVAQVIAASGSVVGFNSSLNLWRPINDPGNVTAFDVTRALNGVAQTTSLDTFIEYDPQSVVFEFQVSGGNWLIAADILVTDQAGQTSTVHYGNDSPNGPLIWNPTLNSPADDDLIQGPLPGGFLSIAANGLTPPAPLD